MSHENSYTSALFEVIPPIHCRPEQVACWQDEGEALTYRLLRDPVDLNELNMYGHTMAIWRENGTLTYLTPDGRSDYPEDSVLCLAYGGGGPTLHIAGSQHKAIAQTAAYFMSLEKPTDRSSHFDIKSDDDCFDFRAAGTPCLTRMFQVASLRPVTFTNIRLSARQLTTLATRPHPTRLTFSYCQLEDHGSSFVDALEKRSSSFGSLKFKGSISLTVGILKRILQLDYVIEELGLPLLDRAFVLLPFSAKVRRLDYEVRASTLSEADLESLNIVTRQLCIRIGDVERDTFPSDAVHSFFRRVAHLSHFAELKVKFLFNDEDFDIPDSVVQDVIHAANANSNLQILDLTTEDEEVKWDLHVETLFDGLKDHQGLRFLKLEVSDESFGHEFIHLRRLLSYNRHIEVVDELNRWYSGGSIGSKLYRLNRIYRGSADLVVKPLSVRSSLVATALVEGASSDFQLSALLLSHHVDALFDLVQFARLDDVRAPFSQSAQNSSSNSRKKRKKNPARQS